MNYTLRQTLGLESAEVFSPSTIILDKTEVSPEVELVNEVQEVQEASTVILKASSDIDLVDESVATLESILTTLEVSMEQHSVNKYTHVLTYITLESIEKRFGLSSGFLTVGLEEAGDENPEVAASGMASKIKDMLSQLKGAGAALLDKIAQGIEVVRKDIAKIAARVKQRIQTLRSNINKDNKGGIELKAGSLKKMNGIADNGIVNGTSFMTRLNGTASTVNGIVNATTKYDILAAYVNGLKQGGQQSVEGVSKIYKAYLDSLKNVKFENNFNDGEEYSEKSEPLINGKSIYKYGLDPEFVKECFTIIEATAKEVNTSELVSSDAPSEETISRTKAILQKVMDALKAAAKRFKTNVSHLFKALNNAFLAVLSGAAFHSAWTVGLNTLLAGVVPSKLVFLLLFLAAGHTLFMALSALKHVFKFGKGMIFGNEKEEDELETELNFKVGPESLINLVIMGTTTFHLAGNERTKDVQKVESLSAKEIEKTCAVLDTLCDTTIRYVSATKDRKALIKEYQQLTKKIPVKVDEYEVDLSKQLTIFIKENISFEVDLCRSMTSVLLTGITYAEASNNAVATPVEEA